MTNPGAALRKVFTDRIPSPRLVTGRPTPQPQPYIYSPHTAAVFAAEHAMRQQSSEGNLAGQEIQDFVDHVLSRPWPQWIGGPMPAVVVRIDQQTPVARYRSGVITVPSPIRKLVVLHELAHHLTTASQRRGGAADGHGSDFIRAFLDLIDSVVGPHTGDILRDELDAAGVAR
jgi:putative metallohydrolase (TIGR04338 family)